MSFLSVEGLSIDLTHAPGAPRIVHGVDLEVQAGSAVSLVGESGSGKTLTLRAILGLLPPGVEVSGGTIRLEGEDILARPKNRGRVRGARIGIVFQESSTALNPLMRVGSQISEVARLHLGDGRRAARRRSVEWLDRVGIPDPEARAKSYPHELSGGMRQRVAIAMALIGQPDLLLCDEPTTALDVTVQAQILELLAELTGETGSSLIFVTHDLPVAALVSGTVNVMYGGRIVESGPTSRVFAEPAHPYTRALLDSVPGLAKEDGPIRSIAGSPPRAGEAIEGCSFEPRCPSAIEACRRGVPPMVRVAEGHAGACRLLESGDAGGEGVGNE